MKWNALEYLLITVEKRTDEQPKNGEQYFWGQTWGATIYTYVCSWLIPIISSTERGSQKEVQRPASNASQKIHPKNNFLFSLCHQEARVTGDWLYLYHFRSFLDQPPPFVCVPETKKKKGNFFSRNYYYYYSLAYSARFPHWGKRLTLSNDHTYAVASQLVEQY